MRGRCIDKSKKHLTPLPPQRNKQDATERTLWRRGCGTD